MRTDGLWRHTCFEAFIAAAVRPEYWEYNLSPSGAWAAYHFTGYRAGMEPLGEGRRTRHHAAKPALTEFDARRWRSTCMARCARMPVADCVSV